MIISKSRPPSHPGEILEKEFLGPNKLTQRALANKMGVSLQLVNTLVSGRSPVTPTTAILLSRVFNNTSHFWMNLQVNYDLWKAEQKMLGAGK